MRLLVGIVFFPFIFVLLYDYYVDDTLFLQRSLLMFFLLI